jgi:hypothetical protein
MGVLAWLVETLRAVLYMPTRWIPGVWAAKAGAVERAQTAAPANIVVISVPDFIEIPLQRIAGREIFAAVPVLSKIFISRQGLGQYIHSWLTQTATREIPTTL